MLESDVTKAVWNYLKAEGWEILGVHYPGASGGLYFHRQERAEKGARGALVVDIVARKQSDVLFVESKVRYDPKDTEKLIMLTTEPAYRQSILAALGIALGEEVHFLRGIAVHQINLRRHHLPDEFFLFRYSVAVEVWGTYPKEQGQLLFNDYRVLPLY
ncbi:MAG TPA: hypothetical protein EYP55_04985 [Anaerolineae bacterium]|nr:hypothetical protein [Anaerolineae bacterium]